MPELESATQAHEAAALAFALALADAEKTRDPFAPTSAARGAAQLSKEAIKSISSLEKQIAKHQQKILNFKANPTVRPGMENLPKELIQRQQQSRIQHLEREIQTFKDNIAKIRRGEL